MEKFIDQFNIISDIESSQKLYELFLNRFEMEILPEEFQKYINFRTRIIELVTALHYLDIDVISSVLLYLTKKNEYLPDIIIMEWSLPINYTTFSQQKYKDDYEKQIEKFNHQLVKLVENETVMNFCLESLTKTNNVPIHCIDILWNYMFKMEIEFEFITHNPYYLRIEVIEDSVLLGINLSVIFNLKLGMHTFSHKISFFDFIMKLIQNEQYVICFLKSKTGKNFYTQLTEINKYNPKPYSNEKLLEFKKQIF